METTKKWWAISIATLCVASHSEDSFHYEYYHLTFQDHDWIPNLSIIILMNKFHEFSCDKIYYENDGTEEKCNLKEFFIRINKNAKISFTGTKNGAEIDIIKHDYFSTKLSFNCLNDDGTFNLEEAKEMASTISIDILNLLN